MASCPVIHKLTDESPLQPGAKCPVEHTPLDSSLEGEIDNEDYRKLKRVMATITKFYRDGTEMKKQQLDHVLSQIETMSVDMAMCQAQLDALASNPLFSSHPKHKSYHSSLETEMAGLVEQKNTFEKKAEELRGFWEWSQVIVKVCNWLESCMEQYAKEELGITLPESNASSSTSTSSSSSTSAAVGSATLPELTDEECLEYGKGLDEITYNLQESQDFFRASIDGRLHKYHGFEKEIIVAQLEAVRKFPEDSARRIYIENELSQDLEYVENNMKDDPATMRRREKMLQSHSDYFKVLKFYKERLSARTPFKSDPAREYDSKFDFNPSALIARS